MKYGEMKTILTTKETRALSIALTQIFQCGYQNELTWKTREQLCKIITDFLAREIKPDLAAITKEGLIFILNIDTSYSENEFDGLFKIIRKRAYKAIEIQTRLKYNM